MATTIITSKARRPKNAWYMRITKVIDFYQMDLGYKDSKNKAGPYSSSPQNMTVPWGPSTACQYRVRKEKDDSVREFKFINKRRESVCFDEVLLNNIENGDGVTPFAQRVTSMCVGDRKKLLGNYLTLLQYAESFIYHNPALKDENGFSIDRTGVTMEEVESNGGSVEDFRSFVQIAKASAVAVESVEKGYSAMMIASRGGKRKATEEIPKPVKLSKAAIVLNNEKRELEDPEGLECQFSKSFLGAAWVPLDNISIAKDLMKVNIFRVYKIIESLKARYDPSQAVLVVCPKNESQEIDMGNVEEVEFQVVQKVHTLCAFKEMDKTNEFEMLPGHASRNVLVYVINTNSPALVYYGNARANDIAKQHVRTLRPQDLIQVFKSLSDKDGSVNGLKVIERMAKHFRVGINETTSLLKICKWSSLALKCMIDMLEVFEVYETLDVKQGGRYTILLQRGEKLSMANSLLNSLAKCEETFVREHFQAVISKEISLQDLVNNYMHEVEIRKAAAVLSQISGYKSIEQLNLKYGNKFDNEALADYIGAEILMDKMNTQAKLLKKYYNNIVNAGQKKNDDGSFVKFKEWDSLDVLLEVDVGARFETIVVDLKEPNQDLCMSIITSILRSDKEHHAGVFVFPCEASQFEVLSFLRSQTITLTDNLKIVPILFQKARSGSDVEVAENVTFGIVFGRFDFVNPPFKILYSDKKQLVEVIGHIAPPASTVAMVTDQGIDIMQVHTQKLLHKVTYFGFKKDIAKFKKLLSKDRAMFDSQNDTEDVIDTVNLDNNMESTTDESSTSPFKKAALYSSKSLDDSGIEENLSEVNIGAGTSSVKRKIDVFNFNETLDEIQSGV